MGTRLGEGMKKGEKKGGVRRGKRGERGEEEIEKRKEQRGKAGRRKRKVEREEALPPKQTMKSRVIRY